MAAQHLYSHVEPRTRVARKQGARAGVRRDAAWAPRGTCAPCCPWPQASPARPGRGRPAPRRPRCRAGRCRPRGRVALPAMLTRLKELSYLRTSSLHRRFRIRASRQHTTGLGHQSARPQSKGFKSDAATSQSPGADRPSGLGVSLGTVVTWAGEASVYICRTTVFLRAARACNSSQALGSVPRELRAESQPGTATSQCCLMQQRVSLWFLRNDKQLARRLHQVRAEKNTDNCNCLNCLLRAEKVVPGPTGHVVAGKQKSPGQEQQSAPGARPPPFHSGFAHVSSQLAYSTLAQSFGAKLPMLPPPDERKLRLKRNVTRPAWDPS